VARRDTNSGRAKNSLDPKAVQVTATDHRPELAHPLAKVTCLTRYGMRYGPARIERSWSHNGYVGIDIWTGRRRITVVITPSGLIRPGTVERDYRKPADLDSAE
jgi:hypothetical protein